MTASELGITAVARTEKAETLKGSSEKESRLKADGACTRNRTQLGPEGVKQKAEFLRALYGDKKLLKLLLRYGHYKSYDTPSTKKEGSRDLSRKG